MTGVNAAATNTPLSTIYNDYNGNITDANIATNAAIAYSKLSLPLGLGYVEITGNFSTASNTAVQVTGLTTTVTIPAGSRFIRLTAYFRDITNTVGVTSAYASIWDGTVGSGTQLVDGAIGGTFGATNYFVGGSVMAIVTPSAGSKTYNVGLRSTAGTNITVENSSTARAFLFVEAL